MAAPIYRYLGFASLLLVIAAPLGAKLGIFPGIIGLLVLALAFILGLVPVIRALLALRPKDAPHRGRLLVAGAAGLPAVLVALIGMGAGSGAPPIHDISTDLQDPPLFVAAPERRGAESNPLTWSEETADIQRSAYPEVQSIDTELAPTAAFERARACLEKMGLEIYAQDAPTRLEAEASTFWFDFKDDMVVRIEDRGNGSVVDVRSVSRVGQGDMGANAERILRFASHFKNGCN